MNIRVKYYGMVAERIGKTEEVLRLHDHADSAYLKSILDSEYKLGDLSYKIAVNFKVNRNSMRIEENDEVAILPPFAGG